MFRVSCACRMLQELPKSQDDLFKRAAGWLGSPQSSPTPAVTRYQGYQIKLVLGTNTEDEDALAEALTDLLQALYKDCIPQARQLGHEL